MNSHQNQRLIPLNLKSLRTRFALRFLKALKKINRQEKIHNNNGSACNVVMMNHHKFHKIKVAADASMAAAVGPKRAWSRAVLSRIRLSWWRRRGLLRRDNIVARKQRRGAVRGVMTQQGQTQELRRLVPGGEQMDMQKLLDETAHYIKCLTTQVSWTKQS
uniref:IBH1-like N-terminal domain-containing protein n=1 Tax=Chenopodium quinoa TaxID=63459 RepID=A0A803MFV2_CHEQI